MKNSCESEKYLNTVIESSLDGIAVIDDQGAFEFVNSAFLRFIEMTGEEIIGQNFTKVFPEDMCDFITRQWRDVREGLPHDLETTIMTGTGEVKHVRLAHTLVEISGEKKGVIVTGDITAYKNLESSLKESEDRYKKLFDDASDSIYCYDSKGYFLDVNKTALEMLGCTKEELIGTHISEWISPESLRTTQEDLKKRMEGERGKDAMILDVMDKKGEHHCMEIRRRIIKQGDKIIVHGIGRDITEKRRLEEELKRSEANYRDLFENAVVPMYLLDTQANILKMNSVGLQLLGATEDDVIGTNISQWLIPRSLERILEREKKLFSGEKTSQKEMIEFVTKNGEHRWAEISSRAVKDGDRNIGIHGIARDITEQVRLTTKLKESSRQFKQLWSLIVGTRGGNTRALILNALSDGSYNAHQLAKKLNMDYKTIRYHLDVLVKHGIITVERSGKTAMYFLSKTMLGDLQELKVIH